MSIYKPSLLDKFKDFVNGLKGNWDQFETHLADSMQQQEVHGLKIESGTWTPTMRKSTGGAITYNSQIGNYYKIGKLVYCNFVVGISTINEPAPYLHARIMGLPFVPSDVATASLGRIENVNFLNRQITARWATDGIGLYGLNDNASTSVVTVKEHIHDNALLEGTIVYLVD